MRSSSPNAINTNNVHTYETQVQLFILNTKETQGIAVFNALALNAKETLTL